MERVLLTLYLKQIIDGATATFHHVIFNITTVKPSRVQTLYSDSVVNSCFFPNFKIAR